MPVEWVGWKPISVLMASMAALEWALPVRRPVTWGSSSRGHLHISAFELFGDALAPVGGSTTVLHCQGALGPAPVDEHLGGAGRVLDEVEGRVRGLIGDSVFGTDGDTMESVVLGLLEDRGLTLGVAESLTGGLIAARLTETAGASAAFRGGVVAYDRSVKTGVVGAPDVAAVSEEMALALAERVCDLLGCDVGLATTGAAGPDPHEGAEPGTVWVGLWLAGRGEAVRLSLPFDRPRVRQFTTISALDLLRRRLLAGPSAVEPEFGKRRGWG